MGYSLVAHGIQDRWCRTVRARVSATGFARIKRVVHCAYTGTIDSKEGGDCTGCSSNRRIGRREVAADREMAWRNRDVRSKAVEQVLLVLIFYQSCIGLWIWFEVDRLVKEARR